MKGSGSSSDNPTPTKCISGLLRSFLCTGSLPTHPADQLNIEPDAKAEHGIKQASATANPCVVARLMGLESLPASPLPSRQKTLGSYLRSRSVNSIDFLSQFDPACHRRHRRVKTSVSFQEVPCIFSLEDKFSVVFPLEEVGEIVYVAKGKTVERGRRKSRNGEKFEDGTVRKKVSSRKMETWDEGRTVGGKFRKRDFNGRASVNSKEIRAVINKPVTDCGERRSCTKQVKKKKVLKKIDPDPTGRALHEIRSKKHDSSQKPTSSNCQLTTNGEIRAIIKSKTDKRSRNEMLEQAFKLTRESVFEINCDWTYGQIWNLEDFEDICAQFGGHILQFLLTQILDELVIL